MWPRWMQKSFLLTAGALYLSLWVFWWWVMVILSLIAFPIVLLCAVQDVRRQLEDEARRGVRGPG
jgi:hypothetical protein